MSKRLKRNRWLGLVLAMFLALTPAVLSPEAFTPQAYADAVVIDDDVDIDDDDGLLENIGEGIVYIVLLPFRLIGGAIDAIF